MSGHASHEGMGHISSMKSLFGVLGALMVLTVVTVAVTYVDLGQFNFFVAMLIATVKAVLVALFFMHLAYDKGFVRIAFVSSLLFLWLFLALAALDTGEYQDTIKWQETNSSAAVE